jgi:predicted Zn-dependent protease
MKATVACCFALYVLCCTPCVRAQEDLVTSAMRDELDRSMKTLQLETLEKPYFIAYRIQDSSVTYASATLGSLRNSNTSHSRLLTVEMRVGDYALDNTNFITAPAAFVGVSRGFPLPLEDNYKELRRQIWLATDAAYKRALGDFARKRAALQNRTRTEELPDFTKVQPVSLRDEAPPARVEQAALEKMVRELSGLFRRMPEVYSSSVNLTVSETLTRQIDSEGTAFVRRTPEVIFRSLASTQAADGMPLEDFVAAYGRSLSDLPSQEELAKQIRQLGSHLAQLRSAPLPDRYIGPVLFEGQAAAELFGHVFVPNLLARRRPVSDNARLPSPAENPFLDKMGARVLPQGFDVIDVPTRDIYEGAHLFGGYRIDDDGVSARDVTLVQKGILKTLLSTRVPVRSVLETNGHRRGSMAAPSNVIVTTEKGLSDDELRAELLRLVKQRGLDYGMVVRRLSYSLRSPTMDPFVTMVVSGPVPNPGETNPILVYKVFSDGHEELVRDTEVSAITYTEFKDIAAASTAASVYTTAFSPGGALVSFRVPSLLFDDITVKKPSGEIPKPPVVPSPLADYANPKASAGGDLEQQ